MKLNLSSKVKNILWIVFVVAMVVVFVVCIFINSGPEHIEDTNGADNYSLQMITEQDVIEQKMGEKGTISKTELSYNFAGVGISTGKKYSSKKFTGVYLLYRTTLIKGSDIYVSLAEFEINAGNFAFYIVFDGEIVGQVTPSETAFAEFRLDNVEKTGALEYVMAGESANFTFIAPTEIE